MQTDYMWEYRLDGVKLNWSSDLPTGTYYYVSYTITTGMMASSYNGFQIQKVDIDIHLIGSMNVSYGNYFTKEEDAKEFVEKQIRRHEELIVSSLKAKVQTGLNALKKRKLDTNGVISTELNNIKRALESLESYCQNR